MDMKEFCEYVEVEGLAYYLNYKNTDWHYLTDKKLLEQCKKLVKAHKKIMKKVDRFNLDNANN